jgi:hypothetical protein
VAAESRQNALLLTTKQRTSRVSAVAPNREDKAHGAFREALRARAGLTQGELADKLGKSQTMVSQAEGGKPRIGERYPLHRSLQAHTRNGGTPDSVLNPWALAPEMNELPEDAGIACPAFVAHGFERECSCGPQIAEMGTMNKGKHSVLTSVVCLVGTASAIVGVAACFSTTGASTETSDSSTPAKLGDGSNAIVDSSTRKTSWMAAFFAPARPPRGSSMT